MPGRQQPGADDVRTALHAALAKLRAAEEQIAQAATLEELDRGRGALAVARAEVQHLVRLAKAERGIPLRSVEETEALYRALLERLAGRRAPPSGADGRPGAAEAEG